MRWVRKVWSAFHDDAKVQRKLHGWATVVWLAASVPICIFLKDSLPVIVFMSVYAIVTGHWSAWQGVRAEQKADE